MKTLAFIGFLLCGFALSAQEITVAAAADLQYALPEVAHFYEAKTGQHVKLTFGSSGNLFAAIQNGAPYDLFFSADTLYAQKLAETGQGLSPSLYEYAVGQLVLWAPRSSPLDLQRGMELLLQPQVHKIAIANPRHAPYGRAAEEALKSAGIYARVQPKLVLGENISQTAQFVESGNADVGLLSLSLVIAPPGKNAAMPGKYWVVPGKLYQPLRQAAIVIKGAHEESANRFLAFIRSKEGQNVLQQYGFRLSR